jgi:hypothetical protein
MTHKFQHAVNSARQQHPYQKKVNKKQLILFPMDIVSLFLHIFVGHYNVQLIKASTGALIIFTTPVHSILDQSDFISEFTYT